MASYQPITRGWVRCAATGRMIPGSISWEYRGRHMLHRIAAEFERTGTTCSTAKKQDGPELAGSEEFTAKVASTRQPRLPGSKRKRRANKRVALPGTKEFSSSSTNRDEVALASD